MVSDKEIEAAIPNLRGFFMALEAGVVNYEYGLPIATKSILEAAEAVRVQDAKLRMKELDKLCKCVEDVQYSFGVLDNICGYCGKPLPQPPKEGKSK